MLVLEPSKRYTIEQIKCHRWMQVNYTANNTSSQSPLTNVIGNDRVSNGSPPPNSHEAMEQILKLIQSLGIDSNKTREVRTVVAM